MKETRKQKIARQQAAVAERQYLEIEALQERLDVAGGPSRLPTMERSEVCHGCGETVEAVFVLRLCAPCLSTSRRATKALGGPSRLRDALETIAAMRPATDDAPAAFYRARQHAKTALADQEPSE